MLKRVFWVVLFLLSFLKGSSEHIMGGEITWDIVKVGPDAGKFIFNMKLYRDCISALSLPPALSLSVLNHPSVSSIPMNKTAQTDISPVCYPGGTSINCANGDQGAVEEFIYQSAPVLLSGVPPAQGWVFAYASCCRNPAVSNLQDPANDGMTLRAIMYSFNSTNTFPAFDSSPKFLESPSTIICTGYPFTYNQNAVDDELDSLSYSFAQPFDDNSLTSPSPLVFASGYSYNNPLPGTQHAANNKPAMINKSTGEVSFTSFTSGNFVVVVKVQAWKCGQLVAEIFREIQMVLLPCAGNSPPSVTAPFQDTFGNYTLYSDTVVAGTLVTFNFQGTDPELLPNSSPQTVTISATGSQFGTGYVNAASGCLNPPCATLNPPPPVSAPTTANISFSWQTDCSHLLTSSQSSACAKTSNTYNFVIKTKDDYCPAPAFKISTISITVLALPIVPSPELRCVSVLPNGDVALTWLPSSDPSGTFDSYHIYYSVSPTGPFLLLDSIFNINQSTYTHVGAGAQTKSVYYYIETRSGCMGAVYAPAIDTLQSIYLDVSNPGNGTAELKWNAIAQPPLSSSAKNYQVYREYPAGSWTLAGTTPNLKLVDTITVCSAFINYRIELNDASGCTSVSSVDGDNFKDIIVPKIPVLDSVSVNASNQVILGWSASTSPDVNGYIVYQKINGFWSAIDTVWGNVLNYVNATSNAGAASEEYRIAAIDSCRNPSPLGINHQTIFLTQTPNICTLENTLSWNSYVNMNPSVAGYKIFVSTNGGAFVLEGTVSASSTGYTHKGLLLNTTYCYYINAYNASGNITSTSNRLCYFTNPPNMPAFVYLRYASVTPDNTVDVCVYVDNKATVREYRIMRSENASGPFDEVGHINPSGLTTECFTDINVNCSEKSYYYYVVAIDSCWKDALSSNVARTILLKVTANVEVSNTLQWNDYEGWPGGVVSYNVYRGVDGVFDPTPIANVPFAPGGNKTLTDDVSAFASGLGVFNYYVTALEAPGNIYGLKDSSNSNIADAYQEQKIYIPNAFVPKGVNKIFLPVMLYINKDEYELRVYNRWGQMVFYTEDPAVGWDGKYNDEYCEGGVYVYWMQVKTSSGEYIEKKGSVLLIR